jgi:hypothetical protein
VDFLDILQSKVFIVEPKGFCFPTIIRIKAKDTEAENLIDTDCGGIQPADPDPEPINEGKYKRDRRFTFINSNKWNDRFSSADRKKE